MRALLLPLLPLLLCAGCATAPPASHVPSTSPDIERVVREGRDGLRPRCLALDAPLNLFFRWNEADRYARTVEATRDPRPCSAWRAVIAERREGWVPVPIHHTRDDARDDVTAVVNVLGVALPDDVVLELEQVRGGARQMRARGVGVDEVLARQTLPLTLADNADLTERYGHGFAGAVYARAVHNEANNAWAFARLEEDMTRMLGAGEAQALQEMKARDNVVVLVSMGLGWDETVDEHTVGYVKAFVETVQSIGVPVEVLERNTWGGLAENAALLQKTVERHLAAGKDVVLLGLCKGVPELLAGAVAAVAPTLDDARAQTRRAADRGRVVGVINMSGMLSGILFGDWVAPFATPLAAGGAVLGAIPLRTVQETGHYMAVLPQLSTSKVERFTAAFLPGLPSDAVYIDVVGVVPGDGLLVEDIGAMGPFIEADRRRDLAKAANDGFVRYPGNELPRTVPGRGAGKADAVEPLAARHYTVVMSGSHMLFDGAFGPWSMASLDNQRALFRATVNFVVDAPAPPAAPPAAAPAAAGPAVATTPVTAGRAP